MILPTEKHKSKIKNPRFMILFGKPKTGKTTLLSELDDCLIVDLEGGSEFLNAMSVQARTISDISEIVLAIKEQIKLNGKNPYKYIAIDNATRLEEICLPYAASMYKKLPIAKNWTGTDVRTIEKGAGYLYIREAVKSVIEEFRKICDNFILIGHTKDSLVNKNGEEMSEMQLDLVGKLSDIICGEADAVGYVYRDRNQTIISFEGGANLIREARADHLRGKKVIVAESNENNEVKVFWDKIYLEEE